MTSGSSASLKPARAVEALLGRSFPGHTMQRVRTPDGRYRYGYVGAGVKDLFNLDPADLMARPEVDHAWVHPEDRQRFLDALERSARDLTPLDEEVRVESPKGDYRWVRSIGHPRKGGDGSIIWDGVALDVHDRRSALETLSGMLSDLRDTETSEDRFSAIAAQDVNDRLDELRLAFAEYAPRVPAVNADVFRGVIDRFEALARSIHAATDLAETVEKTSKKGDAASDATSSKRAALTGRQIQIMDFAASGASNREIAERLGLSEGTVKQHMSRILKKLGAQNRAQAVARLAAQA